MLRRGFSIVLILGYLAGQLAAVPHAHGQGGENQPRDHNARPHIHIHVSWFSHFGHFHDDHSHDDEHTHHHECGSHSHPAFSDSNAGHDDHDNDAVYLASDTGVSLPSKSAESPDCLQFVSAQAIAATPTPAAIAEPWAIAYSPGEFSLRCPLYLALRTLRI